MTRVLSVLGVACSTSLPPSWLKEPIELSEPHKMSEAARHATTADSPNADTTGRKAAWREL